MAGGNQWALVDKDDSSRIFQKEADGPWFRQKSVVIEITRKVHQRNVTLGAGDVGQYSGIMTCAVGGQIKTRALGDGEKFVCRADRTRRIEEAAEYYQQTQVWQWMEDDDDAEQITWNS